MNCKRCGYWFEDERFLKGFCLGCVEVFIDNLVMFVVDWIDEGGKEESDKL